MPNPLLRVLPEPQTAEEIRERIALLEDRINGQLDEAIQDLIDKLKEKLKKLC
jgi:hypothetical protein